MHLFSSWRWTVIAALLAGTIVDRSAQAFSTTTNNINHKSILSDRRQPPHGRQKNCIHSKQKVSTTRINFAPSSRTTSTTTFFTSTSSSLSLVSEEDVLEAVENAEQLWAKALEARKNANALSDRAEEEAEAASSNAMEVNENWEAQKKNKEPITMEQLAKADAVARSNLDAGSMVNKALQASDEADRLEKLAEAALQKSEEMLEQHLVDVPDSSLA